MEGCSTLLIIRKQQIKITMRYHLSLVRMVILKGLQTVKEGGRVKKMEGSYPVWGNVVGNTHDKGHYTGALTTLHWATTGPGILTPQPILE